MIRLGRQISVLVLSHPWKVVAVFVGAAVAAVSLHATAARYDMTYRTMTPRHTPEAAAFEEFVEIFGEANDVYAIGFRAVPLLTPENLAVLRRITERLEAHALTRSVTSLTNALDIGGREGALIVEPFISTEGTDATDSDALARRLTGDPVLSGGLISRDGSTTAIVVRIAENESEMEEWFDYFDDVDTILEEEGGGRVDFYIAGYPYLTGLLMRHMIRDTSLFIPLTLVLMGSLLWLVFGRASASWVPLAPTLVAALLTLGSLTAFGVPMSLLTGQGVLSTLVIVIGLSDAVHLLSRYDENIAHSPGTSRETLLRRTLKEVGAACFLTSLTTAIGFASLGFADVPSVSDFGVFGAIGIGFAYAGALVMLPAVLVLLERRRRTVPTGTSTSMRIDSLLAATAALVSRRRRTIVAVGFIVVGVACAGVPWARIDSRPAQDLKVTDPARRALAFFEEHLGGAYPLELIVHGTGPDAMKDPVVLAAVDHVKAGIEALPYVERVTTPVEFIKKMNRAMHAGDGNAYGIPESSDAVAQYLLLFEMAGGDAEFDRLVSYDYKFGRMSTMMADITPEQYRATLAEIDNLKRGHMPAGTDIVASGEGPLWQAGSRLLISTLLKSLYIAMPLVFVITGVAFRSFRLGALSVLPNVLPITVALGLLAPLDISLRFSTIVAFPLAFGLAIDDTIHFLARYRSEVAQGKSNEEAVRTAITTTGRAMLLTSVLLIAGFVVFFFSNFVGVVHVAVLLWVILSTALLGDLVLLPAMILVFPPRLRQQSA